MKQELEQAIVAVCKKLFQVDAAVVLTRPDEQFGDYATNIALQLAKQVSKIPRDVAQAIVDELSHSAVVKTSVAGPGFINLTLSDDALLQQAQTSPPKTLAGKTVVDSRRQVPAIFPTWLWLHAGLHPHQS